MPMYIHGTGAITPQQSWNDESLLIQAFDYRGVRLPAIEPDYETWFDPRQLRRMSRIMKMGVASAFMALRDAKVDVPDGIITGTAYGCLEDTGSFLTRMVANREQALNPTPFIQSTHNTIGSTAAMLLQCQGYNQTYAHRAFSFESALVDALMQTAESPGKNFLLQGVDELTNDSHAILSRFGLYRAKLASTLNIFRQPRKGTVAGEGAVSFVISGGAPDQALARIDAVRTWYRPDPAHLHREVEVALRESGVVPAEVDLVLVGKNGDRQHDRGLDELVQQVFPRAGLGLFKHLCGEYPTASAFALWLAARILAERHVPEAVVFRAGPRSLRNVVIVNGWMRSHYSLILLRTCRDTI